MNIHFTKYDGAGNDFVIVDQHTNPVELSEKQIALICHRRFGVGADGLMELLPPQEDYDFVMRYYNSDGRLGSMCGNGGRCITAFAHSLGLGHRDESTGHQRFHFLGYDGPHDAEMLMWNDDEGVGIVRLGMRDVAADEICRCEGGWKLDTGSPHFVLRVEDLEHYDVVGQGRYWRNRTDLFPEGTNVDFIEDNPDGTLMVRTYERGVEDETWACGTGVTACAIVSGNRSLLTRGGSFRVDFNPTGKAFTKVQLTGPVSQNFQGEIKVKA